MRLTVDVVPAAFEDDQFGRLERRRGRWRGEVAVGDGPAVPLALGGGRGGPEVQALSLLRTVLTGLPDQRVEIGTALAEHRRNDETASGADDPLAAWNEATPVHVAVQPVDRVLTVEIGLRVPWDEEHTLGARLREKGLVELNGSVLPP